MNHAPRRYRNLLGAPEEDPLGAVANLFDVAMVFAVALILAMFTALSVPELLASPDDFAIVKESRKSQYGNHHEKRRQNRTSAHDGRGSRR